MKLAKVVFTTIKTYQSWMQHWDNFTEGKLHIFVDTTKDKSSESIALMYEWFKDKYAFEYHIHIYSDEEDIFDVKEPSTDHFWNSDGSRNKVWFFPHLRMLYAYKELNLEGYTDYVFFDDDVKCNDWKKLMLCFSNSYDMIAYYLFSKSTNDKNIPVQNNKMHSYKHGGWFNRFPGEGDKLPSTIKEYYGSFYPIVKHSKRAMNVIAHYHKQGYLGYSEGYIPTILAKQGMTIGSLFNPDGSSHFFDTKSVKVYHKNKEVTWSWL